MRAEPEMLRRSSRAVMERVLPSMASVESRQIIRPLRALSDSTQRRARRRIRRGRALR